MKRRLFLQAILLFINFTVFAQELNSYLKYHIHDTSFYGEIQKSWLTMEGISYGTITPYLNIANPIGERKMPLEEGEGKGGILLEANFDLRYPIAIGRPSSSAFYRRARLTFDYRGNFRMTTDGSSPIVPWTNDVGLGLDFTFHDSRYGFWYHDNSIGNQSPLEENEIFKYWTLTTQLHHYSNGQPPGVKVSDSLGNARNDYQSGDFSTNYFKWKITRSIIDNCKHSLFNVALGYRLDMGSRTGLFVYTEDQEKAYGYHRILLQLDYLTGPLGEVEFLQEWRFRTEFTYILGDLSAFQPNLSNSNSDYRMSGHAYVEFRPLNHRSVGYMLHLFAGRDYMNIRYDDIIYLAQAGLTFSLNKYYPAGWRNRYTNNSLIR